MKQTKSGMSPFIVFGGSLVEPEEEMAIAAENEVLVQVESILQAVESLMCVYCVCNIEYSKECLNTFIFLQRNILEAYDMILMSELTNIYKWLIPVSWDR